MNPRSESNIKLHRRKGRSTVESFLDAFADVEAALKRRLGLKPDNIARVSQLIGQYREVNPCGSDSCDQLLWLAEVRNLLTHKRNSESGFPVQVAPELVVRLQQLRQELLVPEPVSRRFRKDVVSFAPSDTLANVVAAAYRLQFSQFPVVREGRFAGLITENEITRWLGHRAGKGTTRIDLDSVTVLAILREKEPDRAATPFFQFASLDAPVTEVMSHFIRFPALEVVLLSSSGNGSKPIEGIVTQWDAARFTGNPHDIVS